MNKLYYLLIMATFFSFSCQKNEESGSQLEEQPLNQSEEDIQGIWYIDRLSSIDCDVYFNNIDFIGRDVVIDEGWPDSKTATFNITGEVLSIHFLEPVGTTSYEIIELSDYALVLKEPDNDCKNYLASLF